VLLKEVHHRVKNNLQIIISMLNLEKDKVDSRPHDVLHDIENRIGTMALIHEQLYDSESLATIRMRDYLENLSGSIASSFNLHHESIAIVPEVEDILFSLDLAIPVGIIANELITNSIKHAFPEGGGTITVSLEELQDSYRFGVRDDGSGPGGDRNRTERQAPEQEAEEEPPFRERGSRAHKSPQQPKQRAAAGLGLTLVEQLAHQIQGATSYEENGGFSVAITFPKEGV
jgi:two-component sensor histidine kinase